MIEKTYRPRSKKHLAFVGGLPCCYPGCGRESQVHHLTIAQPKARGLKAGDNWTVPLCVLHHNALHSRGNERSWWEDIGIDPLALAASLWDESK